MEVEGAGHQSRPPARSGRAIFHCAVELILGHTWQAGGHRLGKSGHVARKLSLRCAAPELRPCFCTLPKLRTAISASTAPGDPTLMISKSGNDIRAAASHSLSARTAVRARIGILGNPVVAARAGDGRGFGRDRWSAKPIPDNLAPTASTTVALALGHALAVASDSRAKLRRRGFWTLPSRRPSGAQPFDLRSSEVMHGRDEIAWAKPEDSLKQVVIAMTHLPAWRRLCH